MTTPTLTTRAALQKLYDAIDSCVDLTPDLLRECRAALAAQPELPDPVGHAAIADGKVLGTFKTLKDAQEAKDFALGLGDKRNICIESVYTASQLQQAVEQAQAKREQMTDGELRKLRLKEGLAFCEFVDSKIIARAIEAHHNIGGKA